MKRIHSLLLASAVAISGVVAEAATPELHPNYVPKTDWQKVNFPLNAFKPQKTKRPVKGKYDRTDEGTRGASPLERTWTFVVGDNYFEGAKGYISYEFEATVDENNNVTFTRVDNEFFKLIAKYNPKTHSLVFSKRKIAEEDGNFIFQEPFSYNWETGQIEQKGIYAYYSEYEDAIVFQDDLGIAWTSYADSARKQFNGYYDILDMSVVYHPVEGEWTNLGNAIFTDAWLVPGYGDELMDNTYPVLMQQNVENENLYRLVNPYQFGPLASTNECTEDGYIVIDVSDTNHVIFKFANAGYANAEKNCSMFFVYNYYGILCLINPYYTPAEILQEVGDDYPYTTYKDGVLTFNNNNRNVPDTRFGLQYPPTFGYYWKDDNGNPANMVGSIVFPEAAGINSVNMNVENGVEYFNLQGLPVANPEPGQILIKRQGTTVTKEVIR